MITKKELLRYGYEFKTALRSTEEDTSPGGYYAGIGEFDGYTEAIYAPDGQRVSIEQAEEEIMLGLQAARQKRADEKQAIKAYWAAMEPINATRDLPLLEPFDYAGATIEAEAIRPAGRDKGKHEILYTLMRNGVKCYVVEASYDDSDDEVYRHYYSDNPEKAGLELLKPRMEDVFEDFFG